MSIAKSVKISNIERYHMICIDSYINYCIQGRIYNANKKVVKEYKSMIQMIEFIEKWIKEMEYPIKELELRHFILKNNSNIKDDMIEEEKIEKANHIKRGEKATFIVRIQFCQNASWQGSIYWLEEEKEEFFRSVLEMITLMISTL